MSEGKEISAIKSLEQHLIFGDKTKIAQAVGVTEPTITRFFAGAKGKYYKQILTEVIKVSTANKLAEKELEESAAA